MILYLAGLQGIDHQLYESAQIDGAGKWRQFTHITWPLLKPTTSLLITLTMINIVQVYDQVVVMTGGGPRGATMTLLQYQYIAGFERRNMGYSSAIGVIVLLILIGAILLQQHLFGTTRRDKANMQKVDEDPAIPVDDCAHLVLSSLCCGQCFLP